MPRTTPDRTTSARTTPARRLAVAALCAMTLGAAAEITPAGAAEATPAADPVAEALVSPAALDSVADVRQLADQTATDPGVRVGIVTDTNGTAPGGIGTTYVMAPAAQAAELTSRIEAVAGVASAEVDQRVSLAVDPMSYLQYGPVRMAAAAGMPATADGRGTTVAVIDTGVMGSHRDLTPALADGRARVLPGTSFLAGQPENGKPGNVDPNGHGTHVAGIIAAARDNGIGGAGVAAQAQILPVRVLNAAGSGWGSDIAAAIRWAHDQGADVINMSLGAPGTTPGDISAAINYATTDARNGRGPSVVVAAAGNNGTKHASMWPAEHPRVVAVAATDAADNVTSFSSRGTYVDVAAPGLDILSTCKSGNFCNMSGTSMASPMVAAAAAVLRSQDQTRTPAQVQSMLEATARDIATPGRDTASGVGLVQLARAAGATTPVAPPVAAPATPPSAPSNVSVGCFPTACSVSFRNASDGGAPITGHLVAFRPTTWAAPGIAGGTSSPVAVGGLTPNTTYTVTVISGNQVGLSAAATVQVRTPPAPAPAKKAAAKRTAKVRRAAARR
ncbi:MAG: S8 family serine peptidase [Actinomycetes bacterium]